MKKYKKLILFQIAIFVSCLGHVAYAHASTEVYFTTPPQNIQVGESFTVDLKVTASDTPINVINGAVTFDSNHLQVERVSSDGGIISLWPVPVSFDNAKGLVNFVGGIENGFLGSGGQVVRIFFLAKKEGMSRIDFQNSFSVFENDGNATQINPWLQPLDVTVYQKTALHTVQAPMSHIFMWAIIAVLLLLGMVLFIIKKYVPFA